MRYYIRCFPQDHNSIISCPLILLKTAFYNESSTLKRSAYTQFLQICVLFCQYMFIFTQNLSPSWCLNSFTFQINFVTNHILALIAWDLSCSISIRAGYFYFKIIHFGCFGSSWVSCFQLLVDSKWLSKRFILIQKMKQVYSFLESTTFTNSN